MRLRNHLVFIGPPGSGKSTVAEELARHTPLAVIATGKRLRQEIASGSAIGREIAPLLEQGHFAPDELMDRLMGQWLAEIPPGSGFVLDGYPRSPHQAEALQQMLAALGRGVDCVISLALDHEAVIYRLSGRRICRGGGQTFTLHISDAAAVERCAARGGSLELRDDDRPEIIAERLRVYERETEPLIDYYRQRDMLCVVDASGSPAEVAGQILQLMQSAGK